MTLKPVFKVVHIRDGARSTQVKVCRVCRENQEKGDQEILILSGNYWVEYIHANRQEANGGLNFGYCLHENCFDRTKHLPFSEATSHRLST